MDDKKIDNMAHCKICTNPISDIGTAQVLGKYTARYVACGTCEVIYPEHPHWLEESYASAIANTDTGLVRRNISSALFVSILLKTIRGKGWRGVDYGGGYGMFTRILREKGHNFFSYDRYCENLFSKQYVTSCPESGAFDILTAFEVFEHFVDPLNEIQGLLQLSETIVFSTQLRSQKIPLLREWWYYGLDHGQHVTIYSLTTLRFLAQQHNLFLFSNGTDFHVLSKRNLGAVRMWAAFKTFDLLRRLV